MLVFTIDAKPAPNKRYRNRHVLDFFMIHEIHVVNHMNHEIHDFHESCESCDSRKNIVSRISVPFGTFFQFMKS